MKIIQKNWYLFMVLSICFSQEVLPLTQRYFHTEDMGYDYSRGTYLIVLADASLESILRDESTGDFIHFKKTQGYNVHIMDINDIGVNKDALREYLSLYNAAALSGQTTDPLLEYVLLVGDVNGSYSIPYFEVASYSYDEMDVTDHNYTYFGDDPLSPEFFIGRWPIRTEDELKKIKRRSIGYVTMHIPGTSYSLEDAGIDLSYLNNALMVAANYAGNDGPGAFYPVTPVWTSRWLMDELYNYGYSKVDTAFWTNLNPIDNHLITTAWNQGVGIIGYRGWGGATGWANPDFRNPDLEYLVNNWKLPVVLSFVCNTGDFNRSGGDHCFAEKAITVGSPDIPTGAVAVVGPSDKDTDTKFNNPMYGTIMDALLEHRVPELAPALHAGKQCLIKEFGDLLAPDTYGFNGTYAEFYHYVYNVLGDPSLPVWLGEPKNMATKLNEGQQLISSHISTIITDDAEVPLMDVVGALLYNNELIAKGLSNERGELVIDFENVANSSNIDLYLNKAQYYQKKIELYYESDDGENAPSIDYQIVSTDSTYLYTFVSSESDYNWIEINETGTNLNLIDDSIIPDVELGFEFNYYGIPYTKLTVCSNGWVSFEPCLKAEGSNNECNSLPYFYNNSIGHTIGPYAMIAPFFDDLDDNEGNEPFNVYFWTNNQDRVIIEWHEVAQRKTDQFCSDSYCEKETFQLILDNSSATGSDNGKIIFQYKEIYDIDDLENHGATVGVEAPDKNSGTQYLFNYSYHANADTLKNELAIRFSDSCGGEIPVSWCDCDGNVEDCNGDCNGSTVVDDCGVCGGDSSTCIAGCTDPNASNYNPDAIIDDSSCILAINEGIIPQSFSLNTYPNPFNPVIRVLFSIPEMGLASVKVFDIRGRELTVLSNQNYQPGYYFAKWDASAYSSGVYFISLKANGTTITQKVLLLK